MATVRELLNKGRCNVDGAGAALGAETSKGCATLIDKTQMLIAIAPGAELRHDEDPHAELDRLILEGKAEIFRGVQSFEENGSDDATETLPDDTTRVTNEGKYTFLAGFTNGVFFNRALHSIKGFKRWNFILVDDKGAYGTKTDTGLTGFTTGMVQPAKLGFASTTTGQTEGLRFQFLERYELDSDYGFIMDPSIRKRKGVTEVKLEYVNEPMAADTTIVARAVLAMDESVEYEGASYENFRLSADGEDKNPTAGDDADESGVYVLTVPSLDAGDDIHLRMPVHRGPDGDFYKSVGAPFSIPE